jgi:predicted membrane channel-forming protein YqfA (hemolysin III family)
MENGSDGEKDQRPRDGGRAHPGSGREETEQERLDRNLSELLQELRVALPGVQVLFAFLLAVPFQQGFEKITSFQKDVYFATLMLTALSAVMLISPTAYHRLTFRYQQKRKLVFYANRFSIIGLTLLALAMTGAIVLITDVLFGTTMTIIAGSLAVLAFGVFWFALPLQRRLSLAAGQEPLGKPEES